MDLQELSSSFLASEQGQQASNALREQGVDPAIVDGVLSHAATAVGTHTEEHAQSTGILGAHPGRNFFAAFAAGLVKGDGVLGAFEDGAEGVVVGRVAEAIADRAGLDSGTAGTIAATATPYVVGFVKQHLGHN
jgi:hypothetical protein